MKTQLQKLLGKTSIVLLIGATLYSCKCDKRVSNMEDKAPTASEAVSGAAAGAGAAAAQEGELDADGNFVRNQGEMQTITLADGTTMEVGSNSTEYKLYKNITGDYKVPSEGSEGKQDWIVMDRVFFASGGDVLDEKSKAQVSNVAKILNAYPNAKLHLGGYTDNDGSEQVNMGVSEKRANKVKSTLVADGVGADRLEAEGFGPKYPVCEANDTDECKAQNRRVDLRLTAK